MGRSGYKTCLYLPRYHSNVHSQRTQNRVISSAQLESYETNGYLHVEPFIDAATLADLRDTLLPKLLSGEIRVPEAEQLAGEAA